MGCPTPHCPRRGGSEGKDGDRTGYRVHRKTGFGVCSEHESHEPDEQEEYFRIFAEMDFLDTHRPYWPDNYGKGLLTEVSRPFYFTSAGSV